MSSTKPKPSRDFYVHAGAPDPIIIRYRANGVLSAFDASLKFNYVNSAGTTTLTVGSGITLSTDEGVANARATVQLTVAQSRLLPEGALTRYELQRTNGGREEVIIMGALVGQGGDNPDA